MKVTLDTNVLISATFWDGEASKIMQLIEQKKIICFLSKEILEEYRKVMYSDEIIEKTKKTKLEVKSVFIKILGLCTIVEPKRKINIILECPADNKILECSVEAKVDYLITYDSRHLLKIKEFENIKIISPTQFLKVINKFF